MRIRKLPAGGWDVALGFFNDEKPVHIAASLDYEDFLKYFKEEIRHRHLADIHFYNGYQKYSEGEPIPINKTEHTKEDIAFENDSSDEYILQGTDYEIHFNDEGIPIH